MWWGASEAKPVVLPELPTPTTKEEYRVLAAEALAEVLALEGQSTTSSCDGGDGEWTQIDFECAYGEPDIKLFDRPPPPEGLPISTVKVTGSVPCAPQTLFRILSDYNAEKRQQWEKELMSSEVIEEIDEQMAIVRIRFKAPFPVSNREFVILAARARLSDGALVAYAKSINYAGCIQEPGFVRSAIHVVAAVVRPVEGNPKKCTVTRLARLDPKGSVPLWLINATKKKAAISLILIRKMLDRRGPEEDEMEPERSEAARVVQEALDVAPEVDVQSLMSGELAKQETSASTLETSWFEEGGGTTEPRSELSDTGTSVSTQLEDTQEIPTQPDSSSDVEPTPKSATPTQSATSTASGPQTSKTKAKKGKGKEIVKRKVEEEDDEKNESDIDEDDEDGGFYESMSSLPWDDAPFKRAYAQHKDELNDIVGSLKDSLARIEKNSQANVTHLASIERRLEEQERAAQRSRQQQQQQPQQQTSSSRSGLHDGISLRDLSWSTIAVAVAWPVVAIAVYHRLVASQRRRPPTPK